MYLGNPSDVEENVKDNLRKAYDSKKGYVISLGCALPIRTKPSNVHAFVKAAKKCGRYPLKLENFS
jgi:uroporphyrinogen-III decarboxylase